MRRQLHRGPAGRTVERSGKGKCQTRNHEGSRSSEEPAGVTGALAAVLAPRRRGSGGRGWICALLEGKGARSPASSPRWRDRASLLAHATDQRHGAKAPPSASSRRSRDRKPVSAGTSGHQPSATGSPSRRAHDRRHRSEYGAARRLADTPRHHAGVCTENIGGPAVPLVSRCGGAHRNSAAGRRSDQSAGDHPCRREPSVTGSRGAIGGPAESAALVARFTASFLASSYPSSSMCLWTPVPSLEWRRRPSSARFSPLGRENHVGLVAVRMMCESLANLSVALKRSLALFLRSVVRSSSRRSPRPRFQRSRLLHLHAGEGRRVLGHGDVQARYLVD
jgi:hypothetical protein